MAVPGPTNIKHIRDGDPFFHKGYKFTFKSEPDQDHGPPWEDNEGCGIVSGWLDRDTKRPGERVLHTDGGQCRFYDWQATMKKARADGWGIRWDGTTEWQRIRGSRKGLPEIKKFTEFEWRLWYAGLTRGEKALLAAEDDFVRMRGWCNDQWSYIGIIVTHVRTGWVESLWGIESDCESYHCEVAEELADEIIHKVRSSHQKAG